MSRVVLDANFVGRGGFNLRHLERLAHKVSGAGVEFVVPEVVVWEWASHAVASLSALEERLRTLNVDPMVMSVPVLGPVPSVAGAIETISSSLPIEYEIWPSSEVDFGEAVQAQVLQFGAGEVKSGVKTGAADHLVLCCIRAQPDELRPLGLIVAATGDKNLGQAIRCEFDDQVTIAADQRQLLRVIFKFEPAQNDLAEAAERELLDVVNDVTSPLGSALRRLSMGYEFVNGPETTVWERIRATLERVGLVELHDLQLADQGSETDRRLGTASLRVFGDVTVRVDDLEQIGEDDFEYVPFGSNTSAAMIDLPISIEFSPDWSIALAQAEGGARIDFD